MKEASSVHIGSDGLIHRRVDGGRRVGIVQAWPGTRAPLGRSIISHDLIQEAESPPPSGVHIYTCGSHVLLAAALAKLLILTTVTGGRRFEGIRMVSRWALLTLWLITQHYLDQPNFVFVNFTPALLPISLSKL